MPKWAAIRLVIWALRLGYDQVNEAAADSTMVFGGVRCVRASNSFSGCVWSSPATILES
jgi:hypothetical protein